jgi:protein arginine N-methyltransferase 1
MDAPQIYSLAAYGGMIADRVRTEAYAQALRQTVKPGSVVLEIGTGPGAFAILACQLGASRVIAIESADIIQVARENAALNHYAERIEFIEDFSTNVTLPLQADVIVSDLHGALPLYGHSVLSIIDARRRFLKPGGALIPREETLWAALVEMPEHYAELVEPWQHNVLDLDLEAAGRLVVNDVHQWRAKPDQLLSAPQLWASLNYSTIDDPDVRGELRWTAERDGTGHGFIIWFDSDVADGVSFSNSPRALKTIYSSLFFPWIHPVQLKHGEKVSVQLEAKLTAGDYVWRWSTQVNSPSPSSKVLDQFDQSMLAGSVLSPTRLHKAASGYIPQLSDEGLLDRKILGMMDGRATLEEIARRLAADNPHMFSRWQDALASASALSRKYSR